LNALEGVFRFKNKARKTFALLALITLLKINVDFHHFILVKLATNKIDTLPALCASRRPRCLFSFFEKDTRRHWLFTKTLSSKSKTLIGQAFHHYTNKI